MFADEQSDVVRVSNVDPTGWSPRNRPRGDFEDEGGCLWYTPDDTQAVDATAGEQRYVRQPGC